MTTWTKSPPSEPGWYWYRTDPCDLVGMPHRVELYRTGWSYSPRSEFGPRIPSPEAIEAAKDALRDAALSLDARTGKIQHEIAAACRAALAKLEAP